MIVYIHGANATKDSFNYIREHIACDDFCLEYDSRDGFNRNLSLMEFQLNDEDNIFFIGHSLGGIYALHLAERLGSQVKGAVTLSTTYGGSQSADFVKYFLPFSQLMRDIGPNSVPMRHINNIEIKCPWTNVITTRGSSPFMIQANDGVVTIDSMRHLQNKMTLIDVNLNHYEVVISPQVVEIIKDSLSKDYFDVA